jgi:hypothetical protein
VNTLIGFYKPDRITPPSTQAPVGIELRYGWLRTNRQSWEQCHCFYRSGVFVNAYSFRHPNVLGQSIGGGLFFEPVLVQRPRWGLSIRALAGITYVSRSYDPIANPGNDAFGSPLNGIIGGGLYARYSLAPRWRLMTGFDYKHISNAGVRLPNNGLNIPAVAVGLHYVVAPARLPDTRTWRTVEVSKRWMMRLLLLSSVKVLEATAVDAQQTYPIFGLNVLAGYHLTPSHVLSAGVELLDDRYFKEQIRRWTGHYSTYRQGTVLAGYEFWQGHFSFTAHMGWNLIRPLGYKPGTYQKYGLLYRFNNRFTTGVIVKTYGENTKNFQLAAGLTL